MSIAHALLPIPLSRIPGIAMALFVARREARESDIGDLVGSLMPSRRLERVFRDQMRQVQAAFPKWWHHRSMT